MKNQIVMSFILFLIFSTLSVKSNTENGSTQQAKLIPVKSSDIKIRGYSGEKIDLCISERIKKQDIEHLIEPFRLQNETRWWQTEFWGKWMLSAVEAWKYNQDPELMTIMENAVSGLLVTQLENGYIGNYAPESQFTVWDILGQKYSGVSYWFSSNK
jgi:DUF1680 family protein